MKIYFLFILLLSLFSCVETETENIWDELTEAQRTALKTVAKDRCINTNAAAFDNIEAFTRNVNGLLYQGDLTVTKRVFTKEYEDTTGPDDEDEETSSKVIYSFDFVGITDDVITYNVRKFEDSTSTYKIITHNFATNDTATGTPNTVLNDHWNNEIIDRICDPSSEYSIVGSIGTTLNYQKATTDTDNTTEKVSYVDTFTIYNRYPVLFQYFNRNRIETIFRRSDSLSQIIKKTWVITEGIDAFTLPGGTTTCEFSDEADFETCLNF